MIPDIFMALIEAVLNPVFSLLPEFSLVDTLGSGFQNIGKNLGVTLYAFNNIFPFAEVLEVIGKTMQVVLPALLTYKMANWLWRHLPTIGGFGPGSG